ncbi:MAG: PTS lactose/cellobiose transporter subunit IIA [Synergistaceae bacterium]|jgi:PTS system cellobiose-specific IIA component|nr:PTS lactose/cellobiose transporter subunit IIA [Synergistaceae bacterium]
MELAMENEELTNLSMKIILHAGDARQQVFEALKGIAGGMYGAASEKLKLAQEKVTLAHEVQTDVIQAEARGESIGHSLLFAHAQDTLMATSSELNIAKQLHQIFEAFDKRIAKLEGGGSHE